MPGSIFELSVAFKYLIPRWRQLSVSIISLVSILVIALVVWLIVVFFSVKDGLENSWIDKIIALTSPVRITPTEKYYNSYYHLVDSISGNTDYTTRTIGEKLAQNTASADPYNPDIDEEIPSHWPKADRYPDGRLKDIVGEVNRSATNLPSAKNPRVSDFETTIANVRLRLLRHLDSNSSQSQQFLDQAAYIGSFDEGSSTLAKALLPLTPADFNNILQMQNVLSDNLTEDNPDTFHRTEAPEMRKRLATLFEAIEVNALKTPPQGWQIDRESFLETLPEGAKMGVIVSYRGDTPAKVILPANLADIPELLQNNNTYKAATLKIYGTALELISSDNTTLPLPAWVPIILKSRSPFVAELIPNSISQAVKPGDIRFQIRGEIQDYRVSFKVPLHRFEIASARQRNGASVQYIADASLDRGLTLPISTESGDPILLPKSFREAGVLVGDGGFISYHTPTPSSVQEQRVKVVVSGFYDPGIMPIGGKYILATRDLIGMIRGSLSGSESLASNGLNFRFDNIKDAPKIKRELQLAFEKAGITPYWKIETYQEYEFTKDLIQQLQSEKNLFSVISLVIIVVACSNIISMLIILVNDKKLEIGILRSMGATSGSIAAIFGFCGMVMGAMGSLIGIGASVITLHYLNELVDFIGRIQGHDLFNPVFYGNTLPTDLSVEALTLVVMTTAFISLLAGVVPAVKASTMRPSAILKAE